MVRCPRCQRRLPQSGDCPTHGRPTTIGEAIEPEALPTVVPPGAWKLGHLVATGGSAYVYAVQRANKPPAVMKWGRWGDRDIRGRFAVEAEVLQAVGPPAAPAYLEHGVSGEWPYLIMEHVTGETLAAWMARAGGRGGLGEILAILTRIAASLHTLHQAGYVHRDLKPENISIGAMGARLLDFGLARPLRASGPGQTQIGSVVGTAHYVAPEQIRTGGIVDHRADIYSFGVIAFEMLTGHPPFVGERRAIEYQHQVCRPPTIQESRTIAPELEEIVLACLSKQPEARPQSAEQLRSALQKAVGTIGTMRGVGGVVEPKTLGNQSSVALAWIVNGEPIVVTRAISAVHGMIVRQRGDGILAAFSALQHDAPLSAALSACRDLVHQRCRIVVHITTALVRRTPEGKTTVYGKDVEAVSDWLPAGPFVGLLLSPAAAHHATGVSAATDTPGFFRENMHVRTDATDLEGEPSLVGRGPVIQSLVTALSAGSTLVNLSGLQGAGKTRVLEAVVETLKAAGHEVVAFRARRRLDGDRPDDDRLLTAICDEPRLETALETAARRRIVLAIDDAGRLSAPLVNRLLASDLDVARILVTAEPAFEVHASATDRVAVLLPPLSFPDAAILVRGLLHPARLLPDVLIERLALRGAGNPGLLVSLAKDMKRRGAIRRHAGSDEWYVAADELDTLLAPPGPSWLAVRALEDLPAELTKVARAAAALGPRFCADEIGAVIGVSEPLRLLDWLVKERFLLERSGWYEFIDASVQEAIYDHVLDERDLIHARAFSYWQSNRPANVVGWLARLAYHGSRAGEPTTAATCWIALARERQSHGESAHADRLLAAAIASLHGSLSPQVSDAVRSFDHS